MIFLPIVDRELRVAARRPITYWTRLAFAMAGAGVVSLALLFAAVSGTGGSRIGGGLFYFLSLLALGFSAFAGVFLTADCLSEEKREGTLGLLFLTDLRGYDVVLGKLLARSLNAAYGLTAIFPLLAVTLTMGGVTAGEFWRMALVCLNTIFFSLAAGMLVSSLSQQNHRAMTLTAGLIVAVGSIHPFVELVFGLAGPASPSPLTAWHLAFDFSYRLRGNNFWYSLLFTHLLSWVLLGCAGVLLPRVWRAGSGWLSFSSNKQTPALDRAQSRRASKRGPLLERNPLYWLAIRKSRVTPAWWLIWAALALGFAVLSSRDPGIAVAAGQHAWSFLLGLLRIFVGVYACRCFAEARQTGSLELLLCTPLTIDEILRSQWMALRRLFLVPTIALFSVGIMPLVSVFLMDLPNAFPAGIMMGLLYAYSAVPKLICDLLAAAWMGMLLGLTAKKPGLAPGLAVLYTVVLPAAAFCVPDVLINLPLLLWARDKLYRELRALSSPRYAPVTPLYSMSKPALPAPPVIRR